MLLAGGTRSRGDVENAERKSFGSAPYRRIGAMIPCICAKTLHLLDLRFLGEGFVVAGCRDTTGSIVVKLNCINSPPVS